jgi:hypothetical protein
MTDVVRCTELISGTLEQLLTHFGITLSAVDVDTEIPGSYWKDPEAGLIGNSLYLRPDTPVHSALHEACHYICMDTQRRESLDTDSGGDYLEESAVCYLQIILADQLPDIGKQRMFDDMDRWGYSFRLGSTQRWFEEDAEDAREWLEQQGLITADNKPTWQVRA